MMLNSLKYGHFIDWNLLSRIYNDIVSCIILPKLFNYKLPFKLIQMITNKIWNINISPQPVYRSKCIKLIKVKYFTIISIVSLGRKVAKVKNLGN